MPSLFNTRKLSTVYPNRNVVNMSNGIRTADNIVRFKVSIDFGQQGKFYRGVTLRPVGATISAIRAELKEYTDQILEIIGHLEDFQMFIFAPKRNPSLIESDIGAIFNRVVCAEHPVMLHAVRGASGMALKIFSEGALDLVIDLESKGGDVSALKFHTKITEMIEVFRDHLKQVDSVTFNQLFDGATGV